MKDTCGRLSQLQLLCFFCLNHFLRLLLSFDELVPKIHYFIVLVVKLRHICVGKKQREDVIIKLMLKIDWKLIATYLFCFYFDIERQ